MDKPKIVTLCGSSKFCDIMAVCAWLIERDEKAIAIGLHLLPQWYPDCPDSHLAEQEGVADAMDTLHFRKIDISDEIFVVNYDDYIGDSTLKEIKYAQKNRTPIRWFIHDVIGEKVMALISKAQKELNNATE